MNSLKKGLSPVIATVLLITLAIILAVIILIWVKSFIGEQVTKDLGSGPETIDSFCSEVSFSADVAVNTNGLVITAQNEGNVPIYGLAVKQKTTFSVKNLGDAVFNDETLTSGNTKDTSLDISPSPGDKFLLVPILIGESPSGKKYYTCDDKFGVEVTV